MKGPAWADAVPSYLPGREALGHEWERQARLRATQPRAQPTAPDQPSAAGQPSGQATLAPADAEKQPAHGGRLLHVCVTHRRPLCDACRSGGRPADTLARCCARHHQPGQPPMVDFCEPHRLTPCGPCVRTKLTAGACCGKGHHACPEHDRPACPTCAALVLGKLPHQCCRKGHHSDGTSRSGARKPQKRPRAPSSSPGSPEPRPGPDPLLNTLPVPPTAATPADRAPPQQKRARAAAPPKAPAKSSGGETAQGGSGGQHSTSSTAQAGAARAGTPRGGGVAVSGGGLPSSHPLLTQASWSTPRKDYNIQKEGPRVLHTAPRGSLDYDKRQPAG